MLSGNKAVEEDIYGRDAVAIASRDYSEMLREVRKQCCSDQDPDLKISKDHVGGM